MVKITVNEDVKRFLIYYTIYRICGQLCSLIGIPGLYPNLISGLCLILLCSPFLAKDQKKGFIVRRELILFTISFFFLTQYISVYLTDIFHNSKFIMNQEAEKSPILVNAAAAGIVGPAAEELLFRRFLYEGLKPMGKVKSSLISSVIFGLCHRRVIQGIYASLWGNVFCFVYEKNQSLKAPFLVHMISNMLSFSPILWISLNHVCFTVCITFISAWIVCLAIKKKGECL